MLLEGSCHCGAVHFAVEVEHPYPFNLCYCSICRKTARGRRICDQPGRAVRVPRRSDGGEHIRVYRATSCRRPTDGPGLSPLERRFCGECGSMLWCWDPRWPGSPSIPSRRPSTPSSLCRRNART